MCSSVRNNKTHMLGQLSAHAGPGDRSHLERPASQFMQLGWGYISERISHYTFDRKLVFATTGFGLHNFETLFHFKFSLTDVKFVIIKIRVSEKKGTQLFRGCKIYLILA